MSGCINFNSLKRILYLIFQVSSELPDKIKLTEERLHKLRTFQLEIDEQHTWLESTRQVLELQQKPGSDSVDSAHIGPQVSKSYLSCTYWSSGVKARAISP